MRRDRQLGRRREPVQLQQARLPAGHAAAAPVIRTLSHQTTAAVSEYYSACF